MNRRGVVPALRVSSIFSVRPARFSRPTRQAKLVMLGLIAVLFCGVPAAAQNTTSPEVKSTNRSLASTPVHRSHERADDDVPLIFLAIVGLGALTLAHTRPTPVRGSPAGSFYAGKNEPARKELPEHAAAPTASVAR